MNAPRVEWTVVHAVVCRSHEEAQECLRVTRRHFHEYTYPTSVRVHKREVRAGGHRLPVWCVVARQKNVHTGRQLTGGGAAPDIRIEYPARGGTYRRDVYGVYEYSEYPPSSVLAGQTRRVIIGQYETLEEAQRHHPRAIIAEGSGYVPPSLDHLPDDAGDL
jgi:hypothetical protein